MDGTISLDERLLRALQRLAEERAISVEALVQETLEEKVAACRPRPRSLGAGASGKRDTARRTGDDRPEARSWR